MCDAFAGADLTDPGGWDKRSLTWCLFDEAGQIVPRKEARAACRSAFDAWAGTGVGLEFHEVSVFDAPDIRIEWRSESDADYDLSGSVVAHADYPPPHSELVDDPPLPIHLDRSASWSLAQAPQMQHLATTMIHEIGHCLGLAVSGDLNPPDSGGGLRIRVGRG